MFPLIGRTTPSKQTIAQQIRSVNKVMGDWLTDTSKMMTIVAQENKSGVPRSTPFWCISNDVELGDEVMGDIILITQFFNGGTQARANELKASLRVNVNNPYINKIILLNERMYSSKELGVNSDKVQQVVIGTRLDYKAVFDAVETLSLQGYIVLSNLDVFFDKTISNVRKSGIANEKAMFCLLRYEYNPGKPVNEAPLFNYLADSQDTWIWHSNYNVSSKERTIMDFQLGIPGCDNTFAYVSQLLGYKVYNTPNVIKSYHNHTSNQRTYNQHTQRTPQPYYSVRAIVDISPFDKHRQDPNHPFTFQGENVNFCNYLRETISNNIPFIVPRMGGIEHMYAVLGAQAGQRGRFIDSEASFLNKTRAVMKNNAGVFLPDGSSVVDYATAYLNSFHKCQAYFDWEPQGDVALSYGGDLQKTFEFIYTNFPRKRFWAFGVADIFHVVHQEKPWTQELSGKRILVISPFADTFEKQLPHLSKIYGRDMFPNCSFTFLKPPITNGKNPSRPFAEEMDDFANRIEYIKDTFDIALVSCGGYGSPILGRIYDMGKSAIYIGGVLQMYFGVYGSRWERERPLVMDLFKNEYWVRPSSEERPQGFETVENSCYW